MTRKFAPNISMLKTARYGIPNTIVDVDILEMMRRLMRRDLRAGIRLDYDDPGQLKDLYERARALVEAKAPARPSKRKAAS
ncbi:MAG TPA: hypothetical protein VNA24_30300 [Hyalangium sp.]|nr:hypothetical protein [Hyalangium sp.]